MRHVIISLALLTCLPSTCIAQGTLLSRGDAHGRAVEILKGDPYGRTPAQVSQAIKSELLVVDGNDENACEVDYQKTPAWRFHVVVEKNEPTAPDGIDGYLWLDARPGKLMCAGLPFLD